MNTAFTNVTLDGNPLASASSGNLNRRFEFEQVAINNVETVEVYKTLTPEMPGTSTGGTINMVTKSAFDREGSLLTYRAYIQADSTDVYLHKSEGWGQEQTHKILPGFDLNFGARLGKNLGVNLNYKNSQLYNNYPRSQYTWEYNPANGGLPTNPALTSWNLQNEQKDTRRQSISGKIDYRLGEHTTMWLTGQWAFYDLLFTDRTTTVNTGNLAPLATTSAPAFSGGTVNGIAGRGSVVFGTINRWKSGVTWDGAGNFEHEFANGSKLTASPYWSQAYSKYRDSTGSWYSDAVMQRTGLTVGFDNIGGVAPSYRVTDSTGAAVNLKDTSLFSLSQVRSRPQTGVDTRSGFSVDYKSANLPFTLPVSVRTGVRLDAISTTAFTIAPRSRPQSPARNSSAWSTPASRTIRSAMDCRRIISLIRIRLFRRWAGCPSCLTPRPATPSPASTTPPRPVTSGSTSPRSNISRSSVAPATRIATRAPRTGCRRCPASSKASSSTSAGSPR